MTAVLCYVMSTAFHQTIAQHLHYITICFGGHSTRVKIYEPECKTLYSIKSWLLIPNVNLPYIFRIPKFDRLAENTPDGMPGAHAMMQVLVSVTSIQMPLPQ